MSVRVVHVISGLGVGGAERALFNLLSAMPQEERGACTVISLTSSGVYGAELERLGIHVRSLGLGRRPATWSGLKALRAVLRQIAPAVIVSWMYHANVVAWLASRGLPFTPALIWNIRHSLYALTDEKPLTRWVIRAHRWLRGGVSAIVFNSAVSREQHTAFGITAPRTLVIPNGFDTALWCPDAKERDIVRQSLGISRGARVVGHVARYHPIKDQATLLKAMQPVMLECQQAHLLLIGREVAPSNPSLKEYFDSLPMDRVHVMEERFDVQRLLQALDVFCLSSRSEAFPNVLGESMASGVVCVTTDVGDARLIVGETGSIVPAGDAAAMANALRALLEKDESELEALGSMARSRILQRYSIAAAVKSYQDLLSSCCEELQHEERPQSGDSVN